MKRWIGGAALGAVLAGAGAAWYASQVERADVQLDRFTVEIDRPGLPPEGVTLLHLSDFHFRAGGRVQARKIARLQQLLAAERYDIVALTGDLVHDAAGFPVALALIEGLRPRLGAFSCPGNHDYAEYSVWGVFGHTWQEGDLTADAQSENAPGWRGLRVSVRRLIDAVRKLAVFARKVLRNELVRLPVAFNDVPAMHAALAARGVQPLVNRSVHVQANGLDLWLAGVDDLNEGGPDLAAALADVPDDAPLILLAHNPDIWLDRACRRGRSGALRSHPRRPDPAAAARRGAHPGHAPDPTTARRMVRAGRHAYVRQPRPGREYPIAIWRAAAGDADPGCFQVVFHAGAAPRRMEM